MKPGNSDRNPGSFQLSVLDMPSGTTIAFILIILLSLNLLNLYGSTGSYGVPAGPPTYLFSWALVLVVLLVAFVIFQTAPNRFRAKFEMVDLSEFAPKLADLVEARIIQIGFRRSPKLLYSRSSDIQLQAFGTFRQGYVVITQAELDGNSLESLETMMIHELAHIKNGDTWKVLFSKQIIRVFLAISIVVLIGSPILLWDSWSAKEPMLIAADVLALLSFPTILILMYLSLLVMQDVREHYANEVAREIKGLRSILTALATAQESRITRTTRARGLASGVPFLSRASAAKDRSKALLVGAQFHKSMRYVLFAGGLAAGTNLFGGESSIRQMPPTLFMGGFLLAITYLIPFVCRDDFLEHIKQMLLSVIVILAGTLAMLMFYSLVTLSIGLFPAVHGPTVIKITIDNFVAITQILMIVGAALVISTLVSYVYLRGIRKARTAGLIIGKWDIWTYLIVIAGTVGVLATMNEALAAFDHFSAGNPVATYSFSRQLALLILLGVQFWLLFGVPALASRVGK